MKKNYGELAKAILEKIGGTENIASMAHCSTRLRFQLVDSDKANTAELEKVQGVIKVINNVQYQVVIGPDVDMVYNELLKLGVNGGGAVSDDDAKQVKAKKQSIGAIILDFLFGVFQPLIPYLIGSGMIKAFLVILGLVGVDKTSSYYLVFSAIADAAYYFLPIAVAITTAEKLKCNKLLAVSAVAALVLPAMTNLLGANTVFLGIELQNISYSYQAFPAILSVIFYSFMEKLTTKYVPRVLKQVLVPFICLMVTVPVTLLVLGPLGYMIGSVLTTVLLAVYDKVGWLAVGLLAAALPLMVSMGMHKALVPYSVATVGELGYEMLNLPAHLAHNMAEVGTCLAIAFRTKNPKTRATALECAITGYTAVVEPTLYTFTMRSKRILAGTMIGSFIGGCFVGIVGIKAFVVTGPMITTFAMFIDEANSMNVVWAAIAMVLSIAASFIAVSILYSDEDYEKGSGKESK